MNFILDTHIFIWYVEGDQRLTTKFRDIIEFSADKVYISIASLWEIAIKTNLGKLQLKCSFSDLESILEDIDIKLLAITFSDLEIYQNLPLHHRDPFDRLIISQAKNRTYPLVSRDANFDQYEIELINE